MSRWDVGRLAVLLFFFLSGFWVAKIWREKFQGETIRFYLARALRIYPLYWLVASFAVFAFPAPFHLSQITLFGIATSPDDPVGVSWSLDIEMQFYVLLPLLALAPVRLLVPASLAVAAIGWFVGLPFSLPLFLPAFALGMMCYAEDWQPPRNVALLSLAAFLAVFGAAVVLAPAMLSKKIPDPMPLDVFSFFLMLPLLPFVAWSLRQKSVPFDRHLGNISYPLYLVHASVNALMAGYPKPIEFAVAIGVAVLLYVLFDRPVDAWRVRTLESHRFSSRVRR